MTTVPHPRDVLFEDGDPTTALPVCDHYSGIEPRMRKSLALQAELGPVFDVTLDGEDGAPVGGEVDGLHANVVQHEYDHLDGILYPMRVTDFRQFGFIEEMAKYPPQPEERS